MPRTRKSTKSSAASRRYHNRVARRYDAIYDDAYWEFHDQLTWQTVRPHIPADLASPCLDAGCGTGKWGLRLLKTGLPVTFLDNSANMVEQARTKAEALGPKARRASFVVADIVSMPDLPSDFFGLTLAMGDPLSICSDPVHAASEMLRVCRPGGVVIATADNKLAALEHYAQRGDIDAIEQFVRTGRTRWLTDDQREQFELHTFTPQSLRRLFEKAGFELLEVRGKTILPIRKHAAMLQKDGAAERLLRVEEELARDSSSAAVAGHLQITARRPM